MEQRQGLITRYYDANNYGLEIWNTSNGSFSESISFKNDYLFLLNKY